MILLRSLKICSIAIGLALSLSACSGLKNALGIDKKPPDEFAIVTKAPLVIPPDFSLRPPRPGAQDSQQLTPSQSAEQTVFGKAETQKEATSDQSQGELALLEDAGADRADGSIRNIVASENKAAQRKDESLTDRLMFWKSEKDEGVSAAEQGRIRASDAMGASPAEGAPPADKDVKAETKPKQTASASSTRKGGFLRHLWPF